MSVIAKFTLPSDYGCIGLINPETFVSFVNENWQLEELITHFVSEINKNHLVAWGCVSGNWNLEFHDNFSVISGYQESFQTIYSNGNLLLVNYDSLTDAAQFFDVHLPLNGMESFQLVLSPGYYLCRIVQLFDPQEAESEEVFYRDSSHFIIELKKDGNPVEPCYKIPWFPI